LGLDPRSSTKREARQRYRELMKRYHPDVASETGAEGRATEINLAYEAVLRGWEDLGGEASGEADGPLDSTAPGDPTVSWYSPFDQEQYWVTPGQARELDEFARLGWAYEVSVLVSEYRYRNDRWWGAREKRRRDEGSSL